MRALPNRKQFYPLLRGELERRGIAPSAWLATNIIEHGVDYTGELMN